MVDAVNFSRKGFARACRAFGVWSHGRFIYSLNFKGYNDSLMLTTTSKVAGLVAVAYLASFFAFASGLINSLIEGRNIDAFIVPTRTVQTTGETLVFTLVLFIGMGGAFMLYQSGKSANQRSQQALLVSGFGAIGIALLVGFMLVGVKL
jgi:hypothetical protein